MTAQTSILTHSPNNVVPLANAIICPAKWLSDMIPVVPFAEFWLQPLYDMHTRQPHGYEMLLQIDKEAGESMPADWRKIDYTMLALLGSVNLGVKLYVNLANETIINVPDEMIARAIACNDIVFEWSEVVTGDREFSKVTARLNRWIDQGVRIAVDDYGVGLDGLWRLSAINYRATTIKLDGGLLRLMDESDFAVTVVRGVIAACKAQGIPVMSECIETREDFDRVSAMGVDMVQGFYIDGGRKRTPQRSSNVSLLLNE